MIRVQEVGAVLLCVSLSSFVPQAAMLHRGKLVLDGPLDQVLACHRSITVHFAGPQPSQPKWPGALGWSGQGTEWTCLCNGQQAQWKQAAEAAGATIVEERSPSLE